jgi:hypothetical protein
MLPKFLIASLKSIFKIYQNSKQLPYSVLSSGGIKNGGKISFHKSKYIAQSTGGQFVDADQK